jgi:hypothetical protein
MNLNLITDLSIHSLILFIILTCLFLLYITKVTKRALKNHLSDIIDDNKKSRKIIWHIYAIRNYFIEETNKEVSSIICNKKIIEYISKYNFVLVKKKLKIESFEIVVCGEKFLAEPTSVVETRLDSSQEK